MSSSQEPQSQAQRLIAQAADDDLSDEQFAELDQLLAGDRSAAESYVDYLELHADLYFLAHERRSSFACENILVELANRPAAPRSWWSATAHFFSRPTPLSISTAALVIGLLLSSLAALTLPIYRAVTLADKTKEPRTNPAVAEISALRDAVWANDQIDQGRGARLTPEHRLHLLAGFVEITYLDGANVLLAGPSEFTVGQLGSGQLHAGKLLATVPERAIGFKVETAAATITDLSTQFGVIVAADGAMSVQVIAGRVRAQPKLGDSQEAIEVVAGQSLRFDGQWLQFATHAAERDQMLPLLHAQQAAAPLLRVDFQPSSSSRTQAGFLPFTEVNSQAGKTYDSPIGPLHVHLAGQDKIENGFFDRNQLFDVGGLEFANLYNDFAFHNSGGKLTLTIAGVEPRREYELWLYCWDTFDPVKHGRGQQRHKNRFRPQGETTGRDAAMTFDVALNPTANQQFAARMRVQSSTDQLSIAVEPDAYGLARLNGFELRVAPPLEGETNSPVH